MQCLHNYVIIFLLERGGIIIAVVSKDTKYFINQYGIFFEGETLYQYCYSNNRLYYERPVVLDKFIIHYDKVYRNKQKLYFRFYPEGKNSKYYMATLNCEMLGTFFKKSIDF